MRHYYTRPKKPIGVFQLLLFLLCLFVAFLTKAQTVESYDPADLSTNVPIDKTVVVDFNQAISIDNPDADIYFFDADNGFAVIQQYTMSDDEVTVSGDKLYINPDAFYDWPANTNVQMRINSDAITGWDGVFLHRFQIEDDERPTLTSTVPAFGETDVSRVTDLVLNFSEDIITNPTYGILIQRLINGAVHSTHTSRFLDDPSITVTSNQITVTSLGLAFDTEYQVIIGNLAIEDVSGYKFIELNGSAPQNFTFTTTESTPPQVVSLSPEDDSENVAYSGQTFTVTFDEEIRSATGYIDIRNSANGLQFEEFQPSDLTFGSNSISFTPQNDFELGSSYYVRIQNVADLEGAFVENTTSNTFWNFTVEPATPPSIVSLTPEDDALEVALESNLIMKFDEPVYVQEASSSPNIQLYALDGSGLVEQFDLPSARVTGAGTGAITIDPTDNLIDDTKYFVRVNNAFEDDKGSAAPNITSLNWSFDTGKPPALTSFTPSHKAIDVPVNTNLVLTFDEPMEMFGSGTSGIQLRKVSDGSFIDGINMNSSEVSGLGTSVLTIDPSQDLPGSTEMYVTISNTALEDQQGERYDGILDNTTWIFTTEELDLTAPTVETFFPLDDATDVSVDTDLTLSFDEPIQFTGTSSQISILQKSNNALLMTIPTNSAAVEIDGQDLNIELPQDLPQSTEVYVHVTGNIIEDLSDNLFGGISSNETWNFTTETVDGDPPAVVSFSPADEGVDVAVDGTFTVTFDEDVFYAGNFGFITARRKSDMEGVGSVSIQNDVTFSGSQISFSFSTDLPANEEIYIQIDGNKIEDQFGNLYGGFSDNESWDFTTGGQPGPVFSFGNPTDDETDVLISDNIIIFFDQSVQKGSGNIYIKRQSNDAIVTTINVQGPGVTASGTSLQLSSSFLYPNGLPPATAVYIEADAGVVTSTMGGNPSEAIAKGTYSFTTGPIVWNGLAWNNGSSPDEEDPVKIASDYVFSDDGSFECGDITIDAGATLTVDGDDLLVINGAITNNGNLIIESGASLFTYETSFLSGNGITIKRNTRFADGKYSFVGTPVGQDGGITGSDLGSYVYKYNETTPYGSNEGLSRWEDASSDELIPGKGYTQADQLEITFIGEPNIGTVDFTGTYTEDTDDANEGWNLVANPYPAAISVSEFLTENTNITGAVYIWDDNGSDTQRGTNADYIVANTSMASATAAGGQSRYNFHLGSAQGFFVKLNDALDTDITFTEDMRVGDSNADEHFFRRAPLPIVRINLTDEQGLFKQTVIGLTEEATTAALNRTYDAQAFSAAADYGVYTLKAGRSLALNGMPESWEAVQLQVNMAAAGSYTLGVELEDFSGALFLRDNQTGAVIDLRNASYAFHAEGGIHTDRFELLASNEPVLGVPNQEVLIYAYDDVLHINQADQEPRFYQVFNLKGQRVLTKEVRSNAEIDVSLLAKGMYLVFDGSRTHKVLLK